VKLLRLFAGAGATCCALEPWAATAAASTVPTRVVYRQAPKATAPKDTALPRGRHGSAPAKAKNPYGGVDRQSAVAVGEAFIRASFTYDTATQGSANPATARSTIWCTPSLRARMLASLPEGSPGAQWMKWSAHKATTTVAVRWAPELGAPAETTRAAYESYDVTVTPHGEHGWTGAPGYYVIWLTFSRTGAKAPWEVADFEVQPWSGPKGYK
jgi:hypothetical protein